MHKIEFQEGKKNQSYAGHMLDLVWVHFLFKLSCGSRSDLVVPHLLNTKVLLHILSVHVWFVKDCSLKCAFYNCVAVNFVNFM